MTMRTLLLAAVLTASASLTPDPSVGPAESSPPMLVTDPVDAGVAPEADITGLGASKDGNALVLTMRLAGDPFPPGSLAPAPVSYLFVLGLEADDVLGWTVTVEEGPGGPAASLADLDARRSVEPFPGGIVVGDRSVTVSLPLDALEDPRWLDLCAMTRTRDPDGTIHVADLAPDRDAGTCYPPPLAERLPTPRPMIPAPDDG